MTARRRCIALMSAQIIEAKAAMDKERKIIEEKTVYSSLCDLIQQNELF